MKILCVVVVVLSLTSVCQSASLACENLLRPLNSSQDLSGRWHYIAGSSQPCLGSTFINFFRPSIQWNITKDTPNVYNVELQLKMNGYCVNISQTYNKNSNMLDHDGNAPIVLLQSGCPDCIVMKAEAKDNNVLLLFSRRNNITAAEMKVVETQAECLGLSKPLLIHSEYENDICNVPAGAADYKRITSVMLERLKTIRQSVIDCERDSGVSSMYETFSFYLEAMAAEYRALGRHPS